MFEEVAEGAKRIAGRVVVGGALGLVALAPLPADAQQQFAANTPGAAQNVSISPQCASLKEIHQQTACEVQRLRAENLAKHKAGNQVIVEASNREGACSDEVKVGIRDGVFSREKLTTILAGRPAKEVGACNILAQLKS